LIPVTLDFAPEVSKEIDEIARRENVSTSEIVRRCIRAYAEEVKARAELLKINRKLAAAVRGIHA